MTVLACAGLVAGGVLPATGRGLRHSEGEPTPTSSATASAKAPGALPVHFEPGPEGSASFVARASGLSAALLPTEAHFAIGGGKDAASATASLRLVGANGGAIMAGRQVQVGKVNYFRGNDPAAWRTDVPTYARVVSAGVYPGVDLAWHGAGKSGALEYDFVVAPGADPSPIAVSVGGAESLAIDQAGDLVATLTGGATIRQHAPVAYQKHGKRRTPVEAAFRLQGDQVRFDLGPYDRSRPLVIDPVLAWSTYLGGSLWDWGSSLDLDADGNLYVAGTTVSPDLPVTVGSFKPFCGCPAILADAFVAKFSPAGTLLYATYVGGSSNDVANGEVLAVSPTGEAHVTGGSQSADFPLVGSTRICASFPSSDAFAFKLNVTGSALVYSTCLGGEKFDEGMGSAVDSAGNTYVVGNTDSADFTVLGAEAMGAGGRCLAHIDDPQVPEGRDAFVTKLSPIGAMVYSTCWGGIGNEQARAVDVDAGGNAYVVGDTDSPGFPQKRNEGVQVGFGSQFGLPDAWVLKVTPKPKPAFSTYLGGNLDDAASAVVVKNNALYVLGGTFSTDLATKWAAATDVAYQRAVAGRSDLFVARLVGTALVPPAPKVDRLTYLGGSFHEISGALAVRNGTVWVSGTTESGNDDPATSRVETSFPTVAPLQPDCALDLPEGNVYRGDGGDNALDAFVARLNKTLTTLSFSTCLGGNGRDQGVALRSTAPGTPTWRE